MAERLRDVKIVVTIETNKDTYTVEVWLGEDENVTELFERAKTIVDLRLDF